MSPPSFSRRETLALAALLGAAAFTEGVVNVSAAAAATPWRHPFTARGNISQGYGPSSDYFDGMHKGIDYSPPSAGTPIYSIGAGVVEYVELVAMTGEYGRYYLGTQVTISHANGWRSTYAHMQVDSVPLHENQVVGASQLVGRIGNTGDSYGAHLHLEMWRDGDRDHLDPYPYIHWADLAQPGVPATALTQGDEMRMIQHPNGSLAIISTFYAAEYGAGDSIGSSANQKAWGDFVPVSAAEYARLLADAAGRRAALLAEIAAL